MKNENVKKLTLSAMFLAIGTVLPLFTAQIKEIGDTLLPMHIPVMLCGLICGAQWGLGVGMTLPFFRSLLFGMPPMYPNAVWMALELATYGLVIGLMYSRFKKRSIGYTYICLITSMLAGRVVWGMAKAVLLGFGDKPFTFSAFIAGGFVDAFLGILIQLILIPLLMNLIERIKK